MPLLYFAATAEGARHRRARPRSRTRIDEAIRDVLANQTGAGGFGLWSAEASGDGWLDAYVTDFLSPRPRAGPRGARPRLRVRARQPRQPRQRLWRLREGRRGSRLCADGARPRGPGRDRRPPLLRRHPRATPSRRRSPRRSSAPRSRSPATSRAPTRCSASPASRREAGEPEQLYRTDYGSGPRDAAGVLALAAEAGSDAVDRQALTGIVTAPGAERSTQEQLWTLLAAHALAGRRGARLDPASTTRRAAGPALRLAAGRPAAPA